MTPATKVIGRRSAAWLIDLALNLVVFVLLLQAIGTEYPSNFDPPASGLIATISWGDTQWVATGSDAGTVFLGVIALGFLNSVLLTGMSGASVGKFALGLRVLRADGQLVGLGKAAGRWALLVVDAFPYFLPIVGFVMALSGKDNQRVGDRAAATYVVGKEHQGRPLVLASSASYAWQGGGGAPMDWETPAAQPPPVRNVAPGRPQWDAARGVWIRWDGQQWLQHEPASNSWCPLR